ncbi:hypothetical protein QJQ45_003537 [Haematococcus lacustris]|nr:hypothetical protein QJQ45_003537 [Haematococcus lacustris]
MAEGRARRGNSDGAYTQTRPHGNSNKFQDSWLLQGDRALWLKDLGLEAGCSIYKARCERCNKDFVSNLHTIKTHEATAGHKNCVERFKRQQSNKRQLVDAITTARHQRDDRRNVLLQVSMLCLPRELKRELISSSASSPAEQTTKLWRYLDGQPITKADISEYIKLAELALVMTPGSVEEQRMFSAMAYLKDDTRNRLQECHLNVCARVFSSKHFELDTFPFERAISKWLDDAAVRGRYRL